MTDAHASVVFALLPERMPALPAGHMTDAQQAAADEVAGGPRGELKGPFLPLMRSPDLMRRVQAVGEYLRFHCPLDRQVRELATLMVARHYSQTYAWGVHCGHLLDPAAAAALAAGRRPTTLPPDQAAAYELMAELLHHHGAADATYRCAVAHFGEQGVVDLLALAGYYALLSLLMNVARTEPTESGPVELRPLPLCCGSRLA